MFDTVLTKDNITVLPMSTLNLFSYENRLMRAAKLRDIFETICQANCNIIQQGTKTEFVLDLKDIDTLKHFTVDVYEHKFYEHLTRIQEVSLTQVKDFIITLCNMHIEMIKHGIIAIDIHEGNMAETIEGIKWLDWGSFQTLDKESAQITFVLTCYLIHRYLLKTTHVDHNNICLDDIKALGGPLSALTDCDFTDPNSWIEVIRIVKEIPVTIEPSFWSENYSNTMEINHPGSVGEKGTNVWNLLQELNYETVTDVGCNKGFYSFLAAKKAKSVIGFDSVPACIDIANNFNKQFKLPVIFAVKTIESINDNNLFETYRFKSDLVLALAIVHHIDSIISPEDFVKMLSSICKKYVLMEDIGTADTYQPIFVESGFVLEKRIPSSPAPRTLSLYRKL